MKFLRGLFGLDFPDPAVNQIWRSQHSGRSIKVTSVEPDDSGTVIVFAVDAPDETPAFPLMSDIYAVGLEDWRRRLRGERRRQVARPGPGHIPPRAMPPARGPATLAPEILAHLESGGTIQRKPMTAPAPAESIATAREKAEADILRILLALRDETGLSPTRVSLDGTTHMPIDGTTPVTLFGSVRIRLECI